MALVFGVGQRRLRTHMEGDSTAKPDIFPLDIRLQLQTLFEDHFYLPRASKADISDGAK